MANEKNLKPFTGKGDPRNGTGGARPGAGRPANWLKSLCDDLLWKNQLAEQMGDIAAGKPVAIKYKDDKGKSVVLVRVPQLDDIMFATAWLADRSHGKPRQALDVTGETTVNLINAIKEASARRGLPV